MTQKQQMLKRLRKARYLLATRWQPGTIGSAERMCVLGAVWRSGLAEPPSIYSRDRANFYYTNSYPKTTDQPEMEYIANAIREVDEYGKRLPEDYSAHDMIIAFNDDTHDHHNDHREPRDVHAQILRVFDCAYEKVEAA